MSDTDFRDELLLSILNCSEDDLTVFEDCKYPLAQVKSHCEIEYNDITLENLIKSIIDMGFREFQSGITAKISSGELSEEEAEDLKQISIKDDTELQSTGVSTTICIVKNAGIYSRLCQENLDEFTNKTGFNIGITY